MSSITQICNRALSAIGSQTTISSLTDGTPAGNVSALWYDNQRQGLLRTAPWGFARRSVALTLLRQVSSGNSTYPYLFKYAYPSDCLKFRYLVRSPLVQQQVDSPAVDVGAQFVNFRPSRENRWLENIDVDVNGAYVKTILSNVPDAIGIYTLDMTDPNMFDVLFESALTSSLAYHFAMPITGNVGMRQSFAEAADKAIDKARVVDGNEALPSSDHQVDWIAGRGVGSPWGYGFTGSGFGAEWGTDVCSWDSMSWGM